MSCRRPLALAAPSRLPLLVLARLAARAPSQSLFDLSYMTNFPPGCFYTGMEMSDQMTGMNSTRSTSSTESLKQCQLLAQQTPGAEHFTYYPFTGECNFASLAAQMTPYKQKGVSIAGYTNCPTQADIREAGTCTSEVPGPGFPGETAQGSQGSWPSGRQPTSLECWPENWVGQKLGCSAVDTLQDTKDGWPGVCSGLEQVPVSFNMSCEESCRKNASCASWQIGTEGNCWQGVGENCFVRPGFTPGGAQRLQHGTVRVLMQLKGWQIVGLAKVFDNGDAYFTDADDAISACQKTCYSDIECQYWQYAPQFGCFVEMPRAGFRPAYPLTLTGAFRNTPFALDCVAGEFVQHSCARANTLEVPEPPVPAVVTSGCAKVGYRWDPNFMARTVEASAEACQARCEKISDCSFWSFWPDKGCQLQPKTAKLRLAEIYRVISGPSWCQTTGGGNDTGSPEHGWLTEEGQQALAAGTVNGSKGKTWGKNVLEKAVEGPEALAQVSEPAVGEADAGKADVGKAEAGEAVGEEKAGGAAAAQGALEEPEVTADAERDGGRARGQALGVGGEADDEDDQGSLFSWWVLLPILLVLCCGGIVGGFLYSSLEERKGAKKDRGRATRTIVASSEKDLSESSPLSGRGFSPTSPSEEEYYDGSESSSYGGDEQIWEAEPSWNEPAARDGRAGGGYEAPRGYEAEPPWPGPQQGYDAGSRRGYGADSMADRLGGSTGSINRSTTRVCMAPEMDDFRALSNRPGEFTV
mmetsp:Transcript_55299/g.157412  ORF Transcript_55299/g.157412 Transcript_55299/m.157412 type:complete len:753 (-) Transcript_55299:189-2447(-)